MTRNNVPAPPPMPLAPVAPLIIRTVKSLADGVQGRQDNLKAVSPSESPAQDQVIIVNELKRKIGQRVSNDADMEAEERAKRFKKNPDPAAEQDNKSSADVQSTLPVKVQLEFDENGIPKAPPPPPAEKQPGNRANGVQAVATAELKTRLNQMNGGEATLKPASERQKSEPSMTSALSNKAGGSRPNSGKNEKPNSYSSSDSSSEENAAPATITDLLGGSEDENKGFIAPRTALPIDNHKESSTELRPDVKGDHKDFSLDTASPIVTAKSPVPPQGYAPKKSIFVIIWKSIANMINKIIKFIKRCVPSFSNKSGDQPEADNEIELQETSIKERDSVQPKALENREDRDCGTTTTHVGVKEKHSQVFSSIAEQDRKSLPAAVVQSTPPAKAQLELDENVIPKAPPPPPLPQNLSFFARGQVFTRATPDSFPASRLPTKEMPEEAGENLKPASERQKPTTKVNSGVPQQELEMGRVFTRATPDSFPASRLPTKEMLEEARKNLRPASEYQKSNTTKVNSGPQQGFEVGSVLLNRVNQIHGTDGSHQDQVTNNDSKAGVDSSIQDETGWNSSLSFVQPSASAYVQPILTAMEQRDDPEESAPAAQSTQKKSCDQLQTQKNQTPSSVAEQDGQQSPLVVAAAQSAQPKCDGKGIPQAPPLPPRAQPKLGDNVISSAPPPPPPLPENFSFVSTQVLTSASRDSTTGNPLTQEMLEKKKVQLKPPKPQKSTKLNLGEGGLLGVVSKLIPEPGKNQLVYNGSTQDETEWDTSLSACVQQIAAHEDSYPIGDATRNEGQPIILFNWATDGSHHQDTNDDSVTVNDKRSTEEEGCASGFNPTTHSTPKRTPNIGEAISNEGQPTILFNGLPVKADGDQQHASSDDNDKIKAENRKKFEASLRNAVTGRRGAYEYSFAHDSSSDVSNNLNQSQGCDTTLEQVATTNYLRVTQR